VFDFVVFGKAQSFKVSAWLYGHPCALPFAWRWRAKRWMRQAWREQPVDDLLGGFQRH